MAKIQLKSYQFRDPGLPILSYVDECYPKAKDPAQPKAGEKMSKDWTCNEHGKVNDAEHLKHFLFVLLLNGKLNIKY